MTILTISKQLNLEKDLVIISRREYEELLSLKKYQEFVPTLAERKILSRARKNYSKKNFLTIAQLKNELGVAC